MHRNQIVARVRLYVLENFLYTRPDYPLGEEDPLLAEGIIDSMGVMELVEFIQGEFDIQVGHEEITEENLGTVGAIATFTLSRLQVALPAAS